METNITANIVETMISMHDDVIQCIDNHYQHLDAICGKSVSKINIEFLLKLAQHCQENRFFCVVRTELLYNGFMEQSIHSTSCDARFPMVSIHNPKEMEKLVKSLLGMM